MTLRRKNQTFRCFFVKNENRRKSTALILRCYVTEHKNTDFLSKKSKKTEEYSWIYTN